MKLLWIIIKVILKKWRKKMNKSGLIPHDFKVLVYPDEIKEVTEGGVHLPDSVKKKEAHAQIYGELIATGKNAFLEWRGDNPKIGDRVCIGKYTGRILKGKDDKEYRLLNDDDIWASLEKGESKCLKKKKK